MQVILKEDFENLGRSGEVVRVKDGYGRNYLIPQGLAVLATPKNLKRIEHEKRAILARAEKRKKEARASADRIEQLTVNILVNVGEEDKLFGSVTAKDIEEAVRAQGVDLPRKKIALPEGEPIKALGVYAVDVHLDAGVVAKLKVWVVKKE